MIRYLSGADVEAGENEPGRFAIDFSSSVDKTVQSGKDDADINVLVRRFKMTGQAPPVNVQPFYGDFSAVDDFQSAMNLIVAARNSFAELPAEVRKKFDNDPAKLVAYLHDPKLDKEEARKLGLLKPEEPVPGPQKVMLVDDKGAPVATAPGGAKEPLGSPAKPEGA